MKRLAVLVFLLSVILLPTEGSGADTRSRYPTETQRKAIEAVQGIWGKGDSHLETVTNLVKHAYPHPSIQPEVLEAVARAVRGKATVKYMEFVPSDVLDLEIQRGELYFALGHLLDALLSDPSFEQFINQASHQSIINYWESLKETDNWRRRVLPVRLFAELKSAIEQNKFDQALESISRLGTRSLIKPSRADKFYRLGMNAVYASPATKETLKNLTGTSDPIAFFREAARLDYAPAQVMMFDILTRQNRYDEGMTWLTLATTQRYPPAIYRFFRGELDSIYGTPDQLKAVFEESLENDISKRRRSNVALADHADTKIADILRKERQQLLNTRYRWAALASAVGDQLAQSELDLAKQFLIPESRQKLLRFSRERLKLELMR